MPVEMAIWRLGASPEPVTFTGLDQESTLEKALTQDIGILDSNLMVIATQVRTDHGKFIDILAMDDSGQLVVIELKRSMTPREVITQTLDYAAWVKTLSADRIEDLYRAAHGGTELRAGYAERFGTQDYYPAQLNETQRLIVVASALDPITERILAYLADFGVPINAVFFRAFKEGPQEYLARTWLMDPDEVELKAEKAADPKATKTPWNGIDYYVSFGHDQSRHWEDGRKYGFVSAGNGVWYSGSLKQLKPGDRVSVYIPGHGYVGVGEVLEAAIPARDARVMVDGQLKDFTDLTFQADTLHDLQDDKLCEWVVALHWLVTKPIGAAYSQKGLFANQNSACKLRNEFTLRALAEQFPEAFGNQIQQPPV